MADPINRLAKHRIIKASADLEVQLAYKGGSAPALIILRELRDRAAESLEALVLVNFCDPKQIPAAITLQNEIKRYDEWVAWMSGLISDGTAFDKEISEEDRAEFLDILSATAEGQEEAIALGLVDRNPAQD